MHRFEEADRVVRGNRANLLSPDEYTSIAWTTRHIYRASSDCLVAAGDFDTAGTAVESTSLLTAISLEPLEPRNGGDNPTGWKIRDALANTGDGGEVLEDSVMLEASLDDFGELLDTSCAEVGR